MIYFAFAFELIAIVFLSYGIEKLWIKHINNKLIRIVFYPGTVTHILSHAILCLTTGATIKNLNIFKLEKNDTKFDQSKLQVVGSFLIAAAPIFGCGIMMLFLACLFNSTSGESIEFSNVSGIVNHIKELLQTVGFVLNSFLNEIVTIKALPIVFIPLALIFAISMAPNREDIKFLVIGFIICGAIPFIFELFGYSILESSWCKSIMNILWHIIALSLAVLTAVLCGTLIVIGTIKGINLTFSHKSDGGGKKGGGGAGKGGGAGGAGGGGAGSGGAGGTGGGGAGGDRPKLSGPKGSDLPALS